MNTSMNTETYEQWENRRRQEIQDEAVAKAESNKILNKARINARHARFGIHAQLPRSQEELAIVAAEEKRVLGVTVEPATNITKQPEPAEILAVVEAQSELIDEQYKSITVGKDAENGLNVTLIGENIIVSERVDCRDYFDIAKPCVVDGGASLEIGGVSKNSNSNIEELLHNAFDLGGAYLNEGAHLSATEIAAKCEGGVSINKVSSYLKEIGYVPLKVQGKRGFRVTIRA